MSGLTLGIVVIVVFLFVVLNAYVTGRIAMNAKKDMKCVYSDDQELIIEVRKLLTGSNIFYSGMEWAPSQTAYHQAGAAEHVPGELWILKKDEEKILQLLQSKFKLKMTPTTITVLEVLK